MHPPVDTDDLEVALELAAALLREAQRVAVLTGAGVSAESGVATFRGAGGLWEGHAVEDVATPMAFRRDPQLVWRFYHARRAALRAVGPNPGHLALAELERRWGDRFTLITQNVDGLHRAAGSRNVLEVHGTLARVRCTGCDHSEDTTADLPELPRCGACGALLRPAVVWFHEMLPEDEWRRAARAAATCQVFLVVGTSAVVYPAAGLIDAARAAGATVIEVNIEPTAAGRGAIRLRGKSGELLPRLLERLSTGG
jgi:NAD-dependent deacetylase